MTKFHPYSIHPCMHAAHRTVRCFPTVTELTFLMSASANTEDADVIDGEEAVILFSNPLGHYDQIDRLGKVHKIVFLEEDVNVDLL